MKAMKSNLKALHKHNPDAEIGLVVKSNAYAHDITSMMPNLVKLTDYFFVGSSTEAIDIASDFILEQKEKLIFPLYTFVQEDLQYLDVFQNIILNICDMTSLDLAIAFVKQSNERLNMSVEENKIHMQITPKKYRFNLNLDSGMHFLGFQSYQIPEVVEKLMAVKEIIGIYAVNTHFATADDLTSEYYKEQFTDYAQMISLLIKAGIKFEAISYHNSASFIRNDYQINIEGIKNIARIGISAYGYYPSKEIEDHYPELLLNPVLEWRSEIISIKKIRKGSFIGYGNNYKAEKNLTIAIVPIGYYEGLPRTTSNNNIVKINDKMYYTIGNVRMNMIAVDISDTDIETGTEVILIDKTWNASKIAQQANTIPYEILTNIKM